MLQNKIEKIARPNTPQRFRAIKTAMVVDDSALQRRILMATLSRWGFDVQEAASAEEALAVCEQNLPDLIISDWIMPGMSGLQFCEAFRKLSKGSYGYFILLTAKSDKSEVVKGLDSGADDFVSKPVNVDELRARIMAGERILTMQRELSSKNRVITEALDALQNVHDALDRDLDEARKFQKSLLQEAYCAFDAGAVSLMLRSSGHVGGDLVGYFTAGNSIGIYGLDVSGHGVSSALMAARLAGIFSAVAPEQNLALARQSDGSYKMRPPDQVIAELNSLVLSDMESEQYFTLFLAEIELDTGRIRATQAGHPHPFIQRRNRRLENFGRGGLPVGLIADAQYETVASQLYPGDRLIVLSDGVTECPDPIGQMLDDNGLNQVLHDLHPIRGPLFFDALTSRLEDHAGTADFPDDVSGICFEFQDLAARNRSRKCRSPSLPSTETASSPDRTTVAWSGSIGGAI